MPPNKKRTADNGPANDRAFIYTLIDVLHNDPVLKLDILHALGDKVQSRKKTQTFQKCGRTYP